MEGRQSNFELMRIVAMVAIVLGHFSTQANLGLHPAWSSLSRVMVNVFILLSAWFLCDRPFAARRITRTYLEVCFYSVPLTLAAIAILGFSAVGVRFTVQGFIPFYGRSLWYASAYISLVLLSPYLNRVLAALSSRQLGVLLAVLAAVFVVPSTIPAFSGLEYAADLAWFVVVYLFVGWFKRSGVWGRLGGSWRYLVLAVGLYALLVAGRSLSPTAAVCGFWLENLRALPNFLVGLAFFVFFSKVNMGAVRPINFLAKGTLAVYIVHQVFAFRPILWFDICRADAIRQLSPATGALVALAVSVVVFVAISLVDAGRRWLECRYLNLRPIRRFEAWLDGLLNG